MVATGNNTGPLVGVVPMTEHLSMKKLAKASGNKKCEMLPLKKLEKTTGYVHGANTSIGRATAQAAQYRHFTGRNSVVLSYLWPSAENFLRFGHDVSKSGQAGPVFAA